MVELYIMYGSLIDFSAGTSVIAYPVPMGAASVKAHINPRKYMIVQQGNNYIIRRLKWYERFLRKFSRYRYFNIQQG